ncbi:hypothetical protein [Chondromyces apiculatus]|nr:hypothetical protein [Chondromyces apiculatus]
MKRSLLTACLLLATTFTMAGCSVELNGDAEGEVKPPVRYEGTTESASNRYTAGLPVRIVSANGSVSVTRGSGDEVVAKFLPFVMGEEDAEAEAQREMENSLSYTIGGSGEIVVQVVKNGGPATLGADIEVTLPAAFNGDFQVTQGNGGVEVDLSGTEARSTTITSENGSIEVTGARGPLDVFTDNGSIDLSVAVWSDQDGSVTSGNGSIVFSLPAATNGALTVTTTGQITEQGIPADWATAENEFGKSYTLGTGAGGQVDIANDDGLGDVTVIAR